MNSQKSAVLVYCRAMFDWRMYIRLRAGLKTRGYELLVVTNHFSVWLKAQLYGIPCKLLHHVKDEALPPDVCPTACVEFRLGLIDIKHARQFQKSLWAALDSFRTTFRVAGLCVWNDTETHASPIVGFARQYGIPTCFFELGNFDGKLFADPEGVNATAHLARHPEILEPYFPNEAEIAAWREHYLRGREAGTPPPQARRAGRIEWAFLVDWFGYLVLRVPRADSLTIRAKIRRKLNARARETYDVAVPERPYVFFPMQVSADSNLVVHSGYDNWRALEVAAARARDRNFLLVVKPHPAETNLAQIRQVGAWCEEQGHLLTTANTTKLVLNAEEVVSINSTVALEAKLLDKPLTMLGRSAFGAFTRLQAYAYAMNYLIDFAPFGRDDATQPAVDRILGILGLTGKEQAEHLPLDVAARAGRPEPA